jgi:hypothetical protein
LSTTIGAMNTFCTTAHDFVPVPAAERMVIKPLFRK